MVDAPSMTTIPNVTLTWREDALYAGNFRVGMVWPDGYLTWSASTFDRSVPRTRHATKSAAREALEIAAAKALRGDLT